MTGPYNPQEEQYRRTRVLLELLQGSGVKITIQTKSDPVLRNIDLLRTFPGLRVGFSINTLDEGFREDMDNAASIGRRLAAMKTLHEAGIRTTCFISPIFPGLTDVPAIIGRVRDQCQLVWLENLNLRGSYKTAILDYIRGQHPALTGLYEEIYFHGIRLYWESLDVQLRAYTSKSGLDYVINDDSIQRPFEAPPVVVNYFYHEQIRKSAKKGGDGHA